MSANEATASDDFITRKLTLGGRVQGVGFRPYVLRTAQSLGLSGLVRHVGSQVEIIAQGAPLVLDSFVAQLLSQAPRSTQPVLIDNEAIESPQLSRFEIEAEEINTPSQSLIPPDMGICDDCLEEMMQNGNRRFRYPFISCSHCGPRYSLISKLPYERQNTSMGGISMCPECRREYDEPSNRRFHTEANACPVCGPRLSFSTLKKTYESNETILQAVRVSLSKSNIIAIKSDTAYHLICDATDHLAVRRLRLKKHRPAKPFAVMFPLRGKDGLDAIRNNVILDDTQAEALLHSSRPIVLCKRHKRSQLARMIAPGLDELGVMLPSSPLQHLILSDFDRPLIFTSANFNDEPVMADNEKTERRLFLIADAFLHHNRHIEHPLEDSLVRVIGGRARTLRPGRGLAPLQLELPFQLKSPLLAIGGQGRSSVALAWEDRIILSPYSGELTTDAGLEAFNDNLQTLQELYGVHAKQIVVDANTDYPSHQWANRSGLPLIPVWHPHAHAGQIAGEHSHETHWVVFSWDGTGLGQDGNLWGGDALYGSPGNWKRVASLRPFRLPDGGKQDLDPWRSALSICWEADHVWSQRFENIQELYRIWKQKIDTPLSTSAGRLFDAASALLGLCIESSYEGQASMFLEAACRDAVGNAVDLPIRKGDDGTFISDWSPLLPMLSKSYQLTRQRAANFHTSLARNIVQQAELLRAQHGDFAVGLSGGVFQNKRLTEEAFEGLREAGFRIYLSYNVPCNDAGLSYGQVIEAAHKAKLIRE